MTFHPFLILFSLVGPMAGAATPVKGPSFECTDAQKVGYKIWLGKTGKKLRIEENGKAREIPLSAPNFLRPSTREGQVLRYNGWNAKGTNISTMLDGTTEFSTQYVVAGGSTRVRVSLVVDNREKLGLNCRAGTVSATVVALEKEAGLAERHSALFEEVVGMRTTKGLLKPAAIQRIEFALRRMMLLPELKAGPERARFVELAGPHIRQIDPRTTLQISARHSGPVGDFWKQLLEDVKYKYYPDSARYSTWVKEGARVDDFDLASVVAGFNQFAASPGFKAPEIREIFIGEVTPAVKTLTDADIENAKTELTKEGKAFLLPLWIKIQGKKTLADYPVVEDVAERLLRTVTAKEFEPLKVYNALSKANKVLLPLEAEPKALFKQRVNPYLHALTARQREDLMGWLQDPAEKAFYLELLR
jgi:hypothetical protein